MKQKIQKITFYYLIFASFAAYLITAISLLANRNWYEYFVSPVYLYCQLFVAGSRLGMPLKIILSLLPLLFVGISFVLYLTKNEYYFIPMHPVLLGNIVLIAFFAIIIAIMILLFNGKVGSMPTDGHTISFLLSSILQIPLLIVMFSQGKHKSKDNLLK